MQHPKTILMVFGSLIALAMSGCGGGGGGDSSQGYSPPQARAEGFTAWSKNDVFAKSAETTPVAMDSVNFNFDGNDDPNAYVELLPPAM